MIRRDFLKLSGLFSAVVFMQFNPLGKAVALPVEAESQGRLYRGTLDGKFYASVDAGKSWQLHTDFGSEFSFVALTPHYSGLGALLEFKGYRVQLALGQGDNIWRTA
jgi:hypothetical protein